jgi:hypothetical protein
MSSDNIYSLAGEFEDRYNKCNDIVQLILAGKEQKARISGVNSELEELDYLLNQMDLEVSLLAKEDQADISIHKTCRNHFNDLRKKSMDVENMSGRSKKIEAVDEDSLNTTGNSLMNLDSGQKIGYEDDMRDLRAKYGVGTVNSDQSVPEELLVYRRKKVMERRLMIAGVIVCSIIVIWIIVKMF